MACGRFQARKRDAGRQAGQNDARGIYCPLSDGYGAARKQCERPDFLFRRPVLPGRDRPGSLTDSRKSLFVNPPRFFRFRATSCRNLFGPTPKLRRSALMSSWISMSSLRTSSLPLELRSSEASSRTFSLSAFSWRRRASLWTLHFSPLPDIISGMRSLTSFL